MKRLFLFISMLLFAWQSWSQVLFTAEASRYKVAVGETFTVTFTLNKKAGDFTYPDFAGFRVVSGPMTGVNMMNINGKVSYEQSARFQLLPLEEGTYTIGKATVTVDGKTYQTKPLTIEVIAERPKEPNSLEAKAEQLVYVKILTNKKSVYVGEPFSARYAVILKANVDGYQSVNNPELTNDFSVSELERPKQYSKEVIDGENVTVADLGRFILRPTRSGTFKPGDLSIQFSTQVPTGRTDWFGRQEVRSVKYVSTSTFPTITVKPLPTAGKPTGFSGAVGDYKLYVSLSRNEVKADESVTLTVELSGSGNIQFAKLPEPELPNSIEQYDPKYKENISEKLSGINGYKRNEYLLIPRYRGVYKIPPITFSSFDPEKEEYITLTSDALEINVTEGPQATNTPGATSQPKETDRSSVTALGEDILFIHTQPSAFNKPGQPFFSSIAHKALLGGLLVALLGIFGFARYRSVYRPDLNKLARKKAAGKAEKVLKKAKTHVANGEIKLFYSAMAEALQQYFKDKFGLQPSSFSTEEAAKIVVAKGGDEQLAKSIIHLIKQADMARFAPLTQINMEADYKQALECINQLEKL